MITIDDASTKDIDDAFDLKEVDDSGWTLDVAIADVAGTVRKDSPIDQNAKKATATRYFASGNSPMLPRKLSESKLSLWPNEPKKVIKATLTFDKNFQPGPCVLSLGEITSKQKLTYKDIPGIVTDKGHPQHQLIKRTSRFAFGLLERRRAAGAMILYDLNNGWVTTEEGYLKQLKSHEDTVGYIIIQELMIAVNTAVAKFAIKNDIPLLFRNHQARAAAPSREDLVAQIQTGFDTPLQTLDTVRQQVHLLLDRADYGVTLKGHYGLNLPAYTHFTSPIRRYADLVVHRQLRAYLQATQVETRDDIELPYTQEALEVLATHINETDQEERRSRSEHMKEQAENRADRVAFDARRIDGLNDKDFERVIKNQVRSGEEPTIALEEIFRKRLKDQRMPMICMAVLMAEAPKNDYWNRLREVILKHLVSRPHEVTSLWNQATQISGWPMPTFETKEEGPPHARTFSAKALLSAPISPEGVTVSSPQMGSILKEAKQRASLALLADSYGLPLPEFKGALKAVPALAKKQQFSFDQNGKDPIMVLHEYCQIYGMPMPTYEYEMTGPPHIPEVTCTCALNVATVGKGKARSKKEAKRNAVQAVLKNLQ